MNFALYYDGLRELIAVARNPPRKPHHHWVTYMRHENCTDENGVASPPIEYYCDELDVAFSVSGHIWFFAYCDPGADDDGWKFPPGFYLAKKQMIDGQFYAYLHYLGTYKIGAKDCKFTGWDEGVGDVGNRLELITDGRHYDHRCTRWIFKLWVREPIRLSGSPLHPCFA
jgi:hypothetical protein